MKDLNFCGEDFIEEKTVEESTQKILLESWMFCELQWCSASVVHPGKC